MAGGEFDWGGNAGVLKGAQGEPGRTEIDFQKAEPHDPFDFLGF